MCQLCTNTALCTCNCLFTAIFSCDQFLPRSLSVNVCTFRTFLRQRKWYWNKEGKREGHKTRLSRLLLSKECIPWSWHGLRWHKWGKRGGHSCGLITLMETLPFCQGLQKTFRDANASCSEEENETLERGHFLLVFTLTVEVSCVSKSIKL